MAEELNTDLITKEDIIDIEQDIGLIINEIQNILNLDINIMYQFRDDMILKESISVNRAEFAYHWASMADHMRTNNNPFFHNGNALQSKINEAVEHIKGKQDILTSKINDLKMVVRVLKTSTRELKKYLKDTQGQGKK